MDITKFFPGKKKDLSDQSKEQSQNDPINVRDESQGSCSVDDSNVFDEGLDDLDCRNILYNCQKLEFDLANFTNENKTKGTKKLEDVKDAIDFIRKKFEDYEAER